MPLITLQGVDYSVGGPLLLENVALSLEAGERVALIGRNGAGKSTLMKLLSAELKPDDGEVRDAVARSLRDDGFIDADAIQVEVKDRVVTLRGEVQDYMEARYAWDDAWDAPGVRGVISKLTVQASA